MSSSRRRADRLSAAPAQFATTRWSVVVAARNGASVEAREALTDLCRVYWYPLYAFVRRKGHSADEAQDLTQAFFARLLEKDFLAAVDRERGKFRSFLMTTCQHFLANEWDRTQARKRGGGETHLSLDFQDAENRYSREPAHTWTPEKLFERRWATTLLEDVLAQLGKEYARAGKNEQFDRLKEFLVPVDRTDPSSKIAADLGMTEGALRVAVHRIRRRYRELLEAAIGRTVEGPEQVQDEIRCLFAAFGS
jgi:RNA polymerase sigma-70 factor (ECF subfamily)